MNNLEEAELDFLTLIDKCSNQLTKGKSQQNNPNPNNDLNDFTQQYFNARYPDIVDRNKVSPPSEFSFPSKSVKMTDKPPEKDSFENILKIIEVFKNNEKYKYKLRNINLFKWLKAYSIISETEIQNIDYALNKLKSHSFQSNSLICEVKDVCVVDCIQVLTVVDINLRSGKLILIKDEAESIKSSNEDLRLIINDYHFNIGDILLCRLKNKEQLEGEYFMMNLREIQILC